MTEETACIKAAKLVVEATREATTILVEEAQRVLGAGHPPMEVRGGLREADHFAQEWYKAERRLGAYTDAARASEEEEGEDDA